MEIDLKKYKENPKTVYFADSLEKLLKEEQEILGLAKEDEGYAELANEELVSVREQQEQILSQMDNILKEEEAEDAFPNEVVLEVRAGAGGAAGGD